MGYEKNRFYTNNHIKNQKIAIEYEQPSSGVHEGEQFYFSCNAEWRPIITGWLSWLTNSTQWQNAESEQFAGQEGISTFLEGLESREGIIVTTAQELENAVCKGVICAVAQLGTSAQALANSNLLGDITFDEDGNLVLGDGSGGSDIIEDALPEEIAYGQAIAISDGMNEFISDLFDYVSNTAFSDSRVRQLMTAQYLLNAGIDDAITNMRNFLAQSPTGTITPVDFADELYGVGFVKTTLSSVIIDQDYTDLALLDAWLFSIDAVTQEQIDVWSERGSPSLEYLRSEYTVQPIFTLTRTASEFAQDKSFRVNGQIAYRAESRRFRVVIEGEMSNADESLRFDGLVYYTSTGQSATPISNRVDRDGGNFREDISSESDIVRRDGKIEYEIFVTSNAGVRNWAWDRIIPSNISSNNSQMTQGSLTITIIDLGKVN